MQLPRLPELVRLKRSRIATYVTHIALHLSNSKVSTHHVRNIKCGLCANSAISFLRLGENNLDMDTVQVIADVLKVSDNVTQLG